MNKISLIIIWFFIIIKNTFWSLQNDIIPTRETAIVDNEVILDGSSTIFLLEYIKESIFGLLAFITIAVFIFIGARLVMARWNPEEFKKAIMQFIYAIVWLAIVAISWAAVKLIWSLNF